MLDSFTQASYLDLIRRYETVGYKNVDFADARPESAHLVLRHDIDMSLNAALTMARTEHGAGLRSTYFVLLRTELYNPLSSEGAEALHAIANLGHTIGLHFDASIYDNDIAAMNAAAKRECEALETVLGIDIPIISFHRPAKSLLGDPNDFGGRPHVYQPRFFEAMGYCSDSRGGWFRDHPLELDAFKSKRAVQLLTHPIWWTDGPATSVTARLDDLAVRRARRFRDSLAANCETYDPAGIVSISE